MHKYNTQIQPAIRPHHTHTWLISNSILSCWLEIHKYIDTQIQIQPAISPDTHAWFISNSNLSSTFFWNHAPTKLSTVQDSSIDLWSEWWGDMTRPTKSRILIRDENKHPQRWILNFCKGKPFTFSPFHIFTFSHFHTFTFTFSDFHTFTFTFSHFHLFTLSPEQ